MAKKPVAAVGSILIHLQVEGQRTARTVDVVEFVGCLAVHETVEDARLAESKTAAWSVSHSDSGLGLVNGCQKRADATEFAREFLSKAEELGVDLSQPELSSQLGWPALLTWALGRRSELKLRRGFLYE